MEKSWYNPIALLRSSLQSALEHITDQFSTELKQAIIDARISITSGGPPSPIKTPTANLENYEIKIQDAYIAFLWCFSYATVAINSILYQNADRESGIVTFNGNPDFPKVQLTLGWAKSLQKKVTLWPEEAARPDRPDKWTGSCY